METVYLETFRTETGNFILLEVFGYGTKAKAFRITDKRSNVIFGEVSGKLSDRIRNFNSYENQNAMSQRDLNDIADFVEKSF